MTEAYRSLPKPSETGPDGAPGWKAVHGEAPSGEGGGAGLDKFLRVGGIAGAVTVTALFTMVVPNTSVRWTWKLSPGWDASTADWKDV